MRSKQGFFLGVVAGIVFLAGCDPKLETGYAPRPLNAPEQVRDAYYAPAYSPEAAGLKKTDDNGPGLLDH